MSEAVNFQLNFHANGVEVKAVVGQINTQVNGLNSRVSKVTNNIRQMLGRMSFVATAQQIQMVTQGFTDLARPGMNLSTSMHDLSAITGVTGQKLKEIEGYARDNAKTFGGDAAQSAEAYKLVLSQLSPEIAKQPAALKAMGASISTLSKTMGGDTVAATTVLTTAMNQYQVSLDDPMAASAKMSSMMNVMAAAAQEGSAELPQIQSALEQSGMAAKTAGVSFEELNAGIQVLDKAGKKGAEGGVAIRNVLSVLSEGRFLPRETQAALTQAGVSIEAMGDKSLPLAQRLQALKPIMNDQALVTKLFGRENSNAAIAMMAGIPEMERLTTAVSGTKSAYEQAAIVMDSPAEKAARIQARVDDLKISLFNGTNGWLGYVGVLGNATRDMTNLWPAVSALGQGIGWLTKTGNIASAATKVWTGIQWLFNASLWGCPVVWLVVGIAALVAGIIYAYKHFETFRGFVWAAWEAIKGFGGILYDLTIGQVKSLLEGLGSLGKALVELFSGNFSNAADEAKNALHNLSGAATLQKLWNDGKAMGAAVKQGYQAGVADFHKGASPAAGIATAAVPGTLSFAQGSGPGGIGGGGTQGNVGTKTNQSIATGGTKSTTIHINIGKQIEKLVVQAANVREGAEKIRDILVEEMTRSIAMGAALGS